MTEKSKDIFQTHKTKARIHRLLLKEPLFYPPCLPPAPSSSNPCLPHPPPPSLAWCPDLAYVIHPFSPVSLCSFSLYSSPPPTWVSLSPWYRHQATTSYWIPPHQASLPGLRGSEFLLPPPLERSTTLSWRHTEMPLHHPSRSGFAQWMEWR